MMDDGLKTKGLRWIETLIEIKVGVYHNYNTVIVLKKLNCKIFDEKMYF